MNKSFLENLEWRFAAKDFDIERQVNDEDLAKLLDAVKKAPTSFGLQPYHVFVVSNKDIKQKLRGAGFDQVQFSDASHVLVFAARTDLEGRLEDFKEAASGGDENIKEKMSGLFEMMSGFVNRFDEVSGAAWATRQAYIALGFALAACAELQIDSCPMEGFMPADFDEILGLDGGLKSVVALCVGYRKTDPLHPKFRFSSEDLFTVVD